MGFSWGAALTQLNKDIPTFGSAYDTMLENKRKNRRQETIDERQAILDNLSAENSRMDLDKLIEEKTRRGEARSAMDTFTGSLQPVDKPISTLPVDQVDLSKAVEAATGKGTVKMPGKTVDEAVTSSNILKFSDRPEVKNTLDYFTEQEKINAKKAGGADTAKVYGILRRQMAVEKPELFDLARKQVEEMRNAGKFSDWLIKNYEATIESGDPIKAIEDMNAQVNKTEEGLRGREEGIAIDTEKAFTTGKAGELGRAAGVTESNLEAIPGFKPIQGYKITDESVKKVKGAAPLVNNMNKIVDEILTDFKSKGYKFTGDDAAKYSANVRYLQMLAKSEPVFQLGVITGPDLMLLEQIIPNPSSIKEGMKSTVLGSVEGRLKEFKQNLNNGATEQFKANGFVRDVPKGKAVKYVRINGKLVRQ
jgi:hypothetical protein